jgi:hypothetical protein
MPKHTTGEEISAEAPTTYEAPVLKLVGNLRDLLAGTGTKFSDDSFACNVADSDTQTC